MKYILLTKEQLKALNKDFAEFLASQQIDVKEWNEIKKNKPKVAQEELEIFCDLVWEDVLNKTKYIEHYSKNQLNLFNCGPIGIHRIIIKIGKSNFNFFDNKDYKWLLNQIDNKYFTYFQAQKKYIRDRNIELFNLIKKGGVISNGTLYKNILKQIK